METARLLPALRRRLPSPVEARSRALVKTLLYRLLMIAITVTVAFGVTGDTGAALQIGFVTNLFKTGRTTATSGCGRASRGASPAGESAGMSGCPNVFRRVPTD